MSDLRRAAPLVALAALSACRGQEEAGGTRLTVIFKRAVDAPKVEHLRVTWVGSGHLYRKDERLPASGSLPDQLDLGSYQIVVREAGTVRKIVARGIAGDLVVAEGAVRAFGMPDQAVDVTLTLLAGRMADTDDDGIPDEIDDCDDKPDPEQGEVCPPPSEDGGMSDDGGSDAGSPPDADLPPDGAPVPPDARPDTTPPDLGSGKTPRGGPCLTNDECETGRCADSRVGKFCASAGMLVVPAGQFARGCPNKDTQCASDERPQRMVMLSGFELNQTEVTQSEYDACVKALSCQAPGGFAPATRPNHPVGNVTWAMASSFCTWAGKRLPTEAEWEKAARGPASSVYPWGDAVPTCSLAHYKACGLVDTVPVAQLAGTSGYGLEDLGGNVAEWVSDFYAANYYAGAPATDPPGPQSGMHLRRGGGFGSDPPALRAGARAPSDTTSASTGFRCARSF